MSPIEDCVAVEKVLGGDLDAFEEIVRRWQAPLVNLAYRFCRDRGRAEEMAQMAFVRAYRALVTWRKEAAFSTWLFALATNLYRTEIRRLPPPAHLALDRVAEPADTRALDTQIEEERARCVRRAVLTLPLKYREPLILFYFHEMNVVAVASCLGLPAGTVKARLFRARELLRSKLHAERGAS